MCHRAVSDEISESEPIYREQVSGELNDISEARLCQERETKSALLEGWIDSDLDGRGSGLIHGDANCIRGGGVEIVSCYCGKSIRAGCKIRYGYFVRKAGICCEEG